MSKKKLQRFADMETFSNVIQPAFNDAFGKDFHLKGQWRENQFHNDLPIVLELGCGKGEYSIGLARKYTDKNFIGIDIKGSRIWRGALTALNDNLKNVRFLRTHIEMITSFFATDEVDEIWITFPDPQLKKKRKRLTSSRFLINYSHFLKNNGLIHLKTDNVILYRYTLALARKNNLQIRLNTDDLYGSGIVNEIPDIKTFYEKQFLSQGMNITYLCFELPHGKELCEPEEEEYQ
jgi:tRNA (guanine-N7-)-methyltransferase